MDRRPTWPFAVAGLGVLIAIVSLSVSLFRGCGSRNGRREQIALLTRFTTENATSRRRDGSVLRLFLRLLARHEELRHACGRRSTLCRRHVAGCGRHVARSRRHVARCSGREALRSRVRRSRSEGALAAVVRASRVVIIHCGRRTSCVRVCGSRRLNDGPHDPRRVAGRAAEDDGFPCDLFVSQLVALIAGGTLANHDAVTHAIQRPCGVAWR